MHTHKYPYMYVFGLCVCVCTHNNKNNIYLYMLLKLGGSVLTNARQVPLHGAKSQTLNFLRQDPTT